MLTALYNLCPFNNYLDNGGRSLSDTVPHIDGMRRAACAAKAH